MQDDYPVRLTAEQIRLLRRLVSEKAMFVRSHPLPEDGDLLARLHEVDEPLYSAWQIMAPSL